MTVDIAQEVDARPVGHIGQRITHEPRTAVAATDADVDDVGNRTPRRALPCAGTYVRRE